MSHPTPHDPHEPPLPRVPSARRGAVVPPAGRRGGRPTLWRPLPIVGLLASVAVQSAGGSASWAWAASDGAQASGTQPEKSGAALTAAVRSLSRHYASAESLVQVLVTGRPGHQPVPSVPAHIHLHDHSPQIMQAGVHDRALALVAKEVRASEPLDVQSSGPIVVATDGSVGRVPGRGWSGGWGWITEFGQADAGHIPDVSDPVVAELTAIERASAAMPADRHLLVMTDSQLALQMIERVRTGIETLVVARPVADRHRARVVKVLDRLGTRMAAGRLVLQWIKGHSGHRLHDAADRLAVVGRRRFQAQLNDTGRYVRSIADEYLRSRESVDVPA